MSHALRFVSDGHERHSRAWSAHFEQVRAEVEAEYAGQWAAASWWQRIKLRRLIRQEIARRLPAPPSNQSMYGKGG